jgi:alanyl-tRNA synthetase
MSVLQNASGMLKVKPLDLASQIERLQDQLRQKDKQLQAREDELSMLKVSELKPVTVGAVQFIGSELSGMTADALKTAVEKMRNQTATTIVVLASSPAPDKVAVAAGVSDSLVKEGYNAGNLVKEFAAICGGGGGGRPQVAQAGGKDPSKIPQALQQIRTLVANHSK